MSSDGGVEACHLTVHYILIILGKIKQIYWWLYIFSFIYLAKYLQIRILYHIYKEDLDSVANCYSDFNKKFDDIRDAFKDVTNEDIKNTARDIKASCEALKQKIDDKENPER